MIPYIRKTIIGDCTLYLADCLELMEYLDEFDHAIFDPPYEQHMHSAKASARGRRKDGTAISAPLGFASIEGMRGDIVRHVEKLSDGWVIAFCTPEGVAAWRDAIEAAAGMRYKRACTWVKPDSTPQLNGQGPAMGAEYFVSAWSGQAEGFEKFVTAWSAKGHSRWNAGGRRGVYTALTNPTERCKIPDPANPGRMMSAHPTEKPQKLMRALVADFTNPGDHILDPFMGIGSTGVACVALGRKFTGIEINPEYYELAVKRCREATAQADLFITPANAKSTQEQMEI